MTENGILKECGLCKIPNILQRSHLIPASIYKIAMEKNFPNDKQKNLVIQEFDRKTAIATNDQIFSYFLCHDCEQRFSRMGEDTIARDCYIDDTKFLLEKNLDAIKPVHTTTLKKIYLPLEVPHHEQYLYFAASIIWRASACSWGDKYNLGNYSLGDKYQEELRLYLLEKEPFPKNINLFIHVYNDPVKIPIINFPQMNNKSGILRSFFFIPCMQFHFIIGARKHQAKILFSHYNSNLLFINEQFSLTPQYKTLIARQSDLQLKGKAIKEIHKKIFTEDVGL